ncbi:MAG TPA: tetratricopeptide repeat protein [Ferruginibacter sp.]|nr:tetratricopeptide repeat protein [Ferruginibacter sp.]HMP21322.1 tetratricopeptide repeat protein [Ferruginibacter sp.]
MKMIKTVFLLAVSLFSTVLLQAQTLEEGRKFLYYERYKSAKAVFEKLVSANPANTEAVYWLGQTMLAGDEIHGLEQSKELYQKALSTNTNSPLLIAGIGHIELLEGKTQDARNRFETAISLSKAKDAAVLNAVGYANVAAKAGDVQYAIEKLKMATTIKKMNDPDVYVNLGDAYKKIGEGGPAQSAYENALALNPNYARASYRIGKIYQTQGPQQREITMRYYNEAIAKDATYAPVYENLYQYLYTTDVGQSAEYLEKFLANTDDDPKNCYYRASMKYAQGLFDQAIASADDCIKGSTEPYPNLYGLKAYSYDRLGDSLKAKAAFESYFKNQLPEKIGPTDYAKYAEVLLKFPDQEAEAISFVEKAIAADTTEAGKIALMKTMATKYEAQKQFKEAGDWYSKIVATKKNVTKTDLYYAGYNYFRGGEYNASIDVFNKYGEKFPEDAFSYYMIGKAKWAIDSTMTEGLANDAFAKAIEVGLADTVRYKNQLIGSYKYFIVYNATIKRDKAAALDYCDKVLWLDPADSETQSNKNLISGMNLNAPAPRQQKPAGSKGK